jgi:aldehyde dehydrogenase (NAD+)
MNASRMRDWLKEHAGKTYGNFIGGEWVAGRSGRTLPLFEAALPANKLGDFPASGEDDVQSAVVAAHKAYLTWRSTPVTVRSAVLFRLADLLERDREELAYRISAEQGKVFAESLGEVQRAAAEARFNAGEAQRNGGEILPSENAQVSVGVQCYPLGVIAAIAPWNFPLVTPVRKIAPALVYGCTVVYKPASATPWTSVKLMELLAEAGVPRGVVNLVCGPGKQVGEALVNHPLVKGISFTGSTGPGLRINALAAARLAKTQLELGGKNAAIVLNYGNLDYAASQIVSAAFACSGQRCTAISRVIVLREKAAELIERLTEKIANIRVGPAWDEQATMGPLINQNQFETVMDYIESGIAEGANLAVGGKRLYLAKGQDEWDKEGYYLQPTMFTNVRVDMKIAKEEIFGPVLSVLEADDVDEAIEIANSTDYGLAASVFTDNLAEAKRFADSLESGMVHINHGTASQAHVPFGGAKQSGFGAFSIGHSNQEFYTGMKVIYAKNISTTF